MKKDFKPGLSSLLGENKQEQKPIGRPKTQFKEVTKISQVGTLENETRATFIVNEALLDKIKSLAYWERTMIKNVVAEALSSYLDNYEKTNGTIKTIPEKK